MLVPTYQTTQHLIPELFFSSERHFDMPSRFIIHPLWKIRNIINIFVTKSEEMSCRCKRKDTVACIPFSVMHNICSTHLISVHFPTSCKLSYPLPMHRQQLCLFSGSLVFASCIAPHVPVSWQTMGRVTSQRIPPLVFIYIVTVSVCHGIDSRATGL
jgi:hypothetical protein